MFCSGADPNRTMKSDIGYNKPIFRNLDSYDTDTESESVNSDDELLQSSVSVVKSNDGGPVVVLGNPSGDGTSVSSLNAPADRYNMIYLIFFIQGIGMLLPWNFFITAKSYFDYKLKDDVHLDSKFENAFALSSMFPNVISLFLNIFLTGRLSRGLRVITCLMIMLLTFILTVILVKVDTEQWTDIFYAVTIFSVVIINLSAGIYQGTIFGVAGIMGSKYMQAIMSGQALAGIFAAIADLISKLADSDGKQPTLSAFVYFLTAAVVILLTCAAYLVLANLPRMKFYFQRAKRNNSNTVVSSKLDKEQFPQVPYLLIVRQILRLALSVCLVFCVTLTMFPAIISKIESVNQGDGSKWTNELFPTLVCFLIFNCGDWCGRIIAGYIQIVSSTGVGLPLLCLSRIVFIPLFLLCNIKNSYLPLLFKHDAYPVVLNVLFSITNGYLGSLCMMFGPRLVKIEYAETAGTIMSLFLTIGLTLGACFSFAF